MHGVLANTPKGLIHVRRSVVVDIRHGLLGDGRIRVDDQRTKVDRDSGGWYVVRDSSPLGDSRVLFRDVQDLALIQWSATILRVAFHAGEGQFTWEDRVYRIGTMIEGEIRIRQEGRLVARGRVTTAGLHLETVATELIPIIRPLGWALVLRSEALAAVGRGASVPSADAAVPPPGL